MDMSYRNEQRQQGNTSRGHNAKNHVPPVTAALRAWPPAWLSKGTDHPCIGNATHRRPPQSQPVETAPNRHAALTRCSSQTLSVTFGPYRTDFWIWSPEHGRVLGAEFALDTTTTEIVRSRPDLVPPAVIATAYDGLQGVFVSAGNVKAFVQAHADARLIFHNAAFDLAVLQRQLGPQPDVYSWVEQNRVWDTMIMRRLLALATDGDPARDKSSLAQCSREFLGIPLPNRRNDKTGADTRTGFGRFLNEQVVRIPAVYLRSAATDTLATWHLYRALTHRINTVLDDCGEAYGYIDSAWLQRSVEQWGPLTHHTQLRSSILMDAITRAGIAVDSSRVQAKQRALDAVIGLCLQELDARGYRPGQQGSGARMRHAIAAVADADASVTLSRSSSSKQWSTSKEQLEMLSTHDPIFEHWARLQSAQSLQRAYLNKMQGSRVHPKYGFLLATGRTYCEGGLNLQSLPHEHATPSSESAPFTVRQAFVPAAGHVFIDADLSQIELVVLGHVWERQLRIGGSLARLINDGQDVHRHIAAMVLRKPLSEVTKAERNSAKPVSFGRPGGMGAGTLQKLAKQNYHVDLSLEDVKSRMKAYDKLCPELKHFLDDEVDAGGVLTTYLGLSRSDFAEFTNRPATPHEDDSPPWLGGMLLKVLSEPRPVSKKGEGHPYTDDEIAYFWSKAQALASPSQAPQPTFRLVGPVSNCHGRCRNGPASDG